MLNESIKAYQEFFQWYDKYKEFVNFDYSTLKETSENHLFGLLLKETYGYNINPKSIYSRDWNRFGTYITIGKYGEDTQRRISWEDNDKQPENEYLLQIIFPSGAYIFGDEYPLEYFKKFFNELKSYNPKYCDTHNKALYFSLETGAEIFNKFNEIYNKYREDYKKESKIRKIEQLKKELEDLENEK